MKKLLIHSNDKTSSHNLKKNILAILPDFNFEIDEENPDYIVVLGGDGTMLSAIRKHSNKNVAFIGLNTGHLGFMSNNVLDNVSGILSNLKDGFYKTETLSMLTVHAITKDNKKYSSNAFNEVVVKHTLPSMLSTNITINGNFFNRFTGDGVIISTPIGSTGYAIWSGGSALHGDIKAIQMTPISPNSNAINNPFSNSIIMPEESKIELNILKDFKRKTIISVDGKLLANNYISKVKVEISDVKVRLIYMKSYDYFDLYREKILGVK